MNLIFIRHGQSLWNLENRFTGWIDIDLSDRGEKEAAKAGLTLMKYNFFPEYCFTSFLIRSKNTATILMQELTKNHKFKTEIIEDWHLNERHYGSLQGLDKIETSRKYGEEQVQIWRRSYETTPPLAIKNSKDDPKLNAIYSDIKEELPLGESLKDVVNRVKNILHKITEMSLNSKVLVVAHGNSIRAMTKVIDNISDTDIVDVNIPTGIPLAYNVSSEGIERIGYLSDEIDILKLQKEVELQSKINNKKG